MNRVCKHLRPSIGTATTQEQMDDDSKFNRGIVDANDVYSVLITETMEAVDLCNKCLDDELITNKINNSYSTFTRPTINEEWELSGTPVIENDCTMTRKVYFSVTEASVNGNVEVSGKNDEEILDKVKNMTLDIYSHNPNYKEGYRDKQDLGCNHQNIEVSFSRDIYNKEHIDKETIIKSLLERLYDVCPDDEGLNMDGKKIMDLADLHLKYFNPNFYVYQQDYVDITEDNLEPYLVKFKSGISSEIDITIAKFNDKQDAYDFCGMKNKSLKETGKCNN